MNNIGNRNSTPESSISNLRPPVSRSAFGSGHMLRSSADMGSNGPMSARGIRPASEVIHGQRGANHGGEDDADKASQQWLQDIGTCEDTLEEMAAATLDQDFKGELSAIEQWFQVLSEAERTAALYALLQQATQVQTRFFIGVLQQMAKSHPMSGILSPSTFGDKDPMSSRLSTAMNRLSVEGSRHSIAGGRPPPSPGAAKRSSGLEQADINNMFPDAAAAIAKQKADYTQKTGVEPQSNRSSAIVGDRASMIASQQEQRKSSFAQGAPSPWAQRAPDGQASSARPKSSAGQPPMGQFQQPPPSAGLRASRPGAISGDNNIQNTTLNTPDPMSNGPMSNGMNLLSPYQGNWGSLAPTPMDANFNTQNSNQANMVANATAMKLAALSTVTNRVQLDDVRKFRRARSSEGQHPPQSPGFIMTNEHGQVLSPQQVAVLQAQQLALAQGSRSRPISPGLLVSGQDYSALNMGMNTNSGYLAAYGQNGLGNGMTGMNLSQYAGMGDNYLSDAGEIQRGRSPRGKRGTSRPPEDPTDLELLKDIPNWLRSLRLHKYTDNLKDIKWQDLVQLDEEGLEARGVLAKGARTKMLKVFEDVRIAQAAGKI